MLSKLLKFLRGDGAADDAYIRKNRVPKRRNTTYRDDWDDSQDALAALAHGSETPRAKTTKLQGQQQGSSRQARPQRFNYEHAIIDDYSEAPLNQWYRMKHWNPGTLVYKGEWGKDWKKFEEDVKVVGITHDGREQIILSLANRPGFRIALTKDRNNEYDKNAVAVWAIAYIGEEKQVEHIGYLDRDTARRLKNDDELDARPHRINLPNGGIGLGLTIDILVRSVAYKKKAEGK